MMLELRAESNSTGQRLCQISAGCVCCSNIKGLQFIVVSPARLLFAGEALLLDQRTPCMLQEHQQPALYLGHSA